MCGSVCGSVRAARRRTGPASFAWIVACILALLLPSATLADPDLPGPSPNFEVIPAGSLVIAMDNDKQNLVAPFNLKAYGLANHLLWNRVPLKWAIRAGKVKDADDFTAQVARIFPTAQAGTTLDFAGGPFIVHADWAEYAKPLIDDYDNLVAVYEVLVDVTVDIRHDILQRRRVGLLDDGGNADIHQDVLDQAGFVGGTQYETILAATLLTVNRDSCFTSVSEPHYDSAAADIQTFAIREFVDSGGNFLAQCVATLTYENNVAFGHFQSSAGMLKNNLGESFTYPNPDLPLNQFVGPMEDAGGSVRDLKLDLGSSFNTDAHLLVQDTPTTDTFAASAIKLNPNQLGSMVVYLGSHAYGDTTLDELNGRRLYLNSVMTPSVRPPLCGNEVDPDPDQLKQISGRVLEDPNGDASIADGIAVAGARVRLYSDLNDNGVVDAGDSFVEELTTDVNGEFTTQVHNGVSGTNYLIAVDSRTVPPSAGFNGGSGSADVWAEQTYGDDPTTPALDLGARYGGRSNGVSDDVDPALTAPTANEYQHLARVSTAAADVTGVEFGFSFVVIVNTRDGDDDAAANRSIQGGLRQFLQNGNAIVGAATSVFRIPTVDPGYDGSGNGEYTIQPSSALPAVGDPLDIDGSTQPGYTGVPIVEIDGSAAGVGTIGLQLPASNSTIRSLVVNRFGSHGIELSGGSTIRIQNSYLGTDVTGLIAQGNGGAGLRMGTAVTGTIVGGSGTENLIAFNGAEGIVLAANAAGANRISANSIHSNGALGIDLAADGVTSNDPLDGDGGPNSRQNYPVLVTADSSGGTTTVDGTLNSTPNTTFTLEFFSNVVADPSGHGEGQTYLGADIVTTDAAGNVAFTIVLPVAAPVGQQISSTATSPAGDTSEFSAVSTIGGIPDISGSVLEDVNGDGNIGDGVGRGSATVSLYLDGGDGLADGVDDSVVTSSVTDGAGDYRFVDVPDGTYWVAVDSKTVSPSATFLAGQGQSDVWAEQTYGSAGARCDDGAGGVTEHVAPGTCYGGQASAVADDASTLGNAEHVSRATVAGADVTGLDSGFSFVVIVNGRDGNDDAGANRTVQGSLRQFLQNGNAAQGSVTSRFNIPTSDAGYNGSGNGEYTIAPSSALPEVTDPVLLDGTTQPGYAGSPLVELDGVAAGAGVDGLRISAGNSTVDSLVINRFTADGIELTGADGNIVRNSYLGTDVSGSAGRPNSGAGLRISAGSGTNVVGGAGSGAANTIGFNGAGGVVLDSDAGSGTTISRNSIDSNAGLGIDLGDDGVTPNDSGDGDGGPNDLQNYPLLTGSVSSGGSTAIGGTISGAPSTSYLLEFFTTAVGDPTGHGEGPVYLGSDSVTTDGSGNASFASVVPVGVTPGELVSATATNPTGSTSEFSANIAVSGPPDLIGSVFEDLNGDGDPGDALGRPSVTVRLYRDGGDGLPDGVDDTAAGSTTTNGIGIFAFTALAPGTYWVSADSKTVSPSLGFRGGFAQTDVWPEQTFGSAGAWCDDRTGGVAERVTAGPCYGGQASATSDDATGLASAEHVARVVVAVSNVNGVRFGFAFQVIVNTRDADDDGGANRTVQGSLRQFLQNSNAVVGVAGSLFNIPTSDAGYNGSGNNEFSIVPDSALETIVDPLILDASTQPGYGGTPIVELNGSSAGNGVSGLQVSAGSSTIRSLVINRFDVQGILLETAGGNTIENCYLGTNVSGTTDLGNAESGILIDAGSTGNTIGSPGAGNVISGNDKRGVDIVTAGNTLQGNYIGLSASGTAAIGNKNEGIRITNAANNIIGGAAAGAGNVISANDRGIKVDKAASNGTLIRGNRIGTDAAGSVDLGNKKTGIQIKDGSGTLVGGAAPGQGNLISGNNEHGIEIDKATATGGLILGNLIGTDATGTTALGNSGHGIYIKKDVPNNTIGGTTAGQANTIAFNLGGGVVLKNDAGTGHTISGNSIFRNTDLGIDLAEDGVTNNDPGDGNNGPNDLQNYPVLASADSVGASTTVVGTLNSTANTTFTVEFFADTFPDASGHGEGQVYLGSDSVTTDASGNVSFSLVLPTATPVGGVVSSTATNPANSTSEFSANITADVALAIVKRAFTSDGTPIPPGDEVPRGALITFLLYINNPGGAELDASVQDVLVPTFAYVASTIRLDNSLSDCAAAICSPAEEAAIYAAVSAQSASTDAVDTDTASFDGVDTIDVGNQHQANAQLDINANSVWAMTITVRVQ